MRSSYRGGVAGDQIPRARRKQPLLERGASWMTVTLFPDVWVERGARLADARRRAMVAQDDEAAAWSALRPKRARIPVDHQTRMAVVRFCERMLLMARLLPLDLRGLPDFHDEKKVDEGAVHTSLQQIQGHRGRSRGQ